MKKKIMTTAITALMLISLISVFQAGTASARDGDVRDRTTAITTAAGRLVDLQSTTDFGWDWIVTGLETHSVDASAQNMYGVVILGLLDAYGVTGTESYLNAATSMANHMTNTLNGDPTQGEFHKRVGEEEHAGSYDYQFLMRYAEVSEDPAYGDYAKALWAWNKENTPMYATPEALNDELLGWAGSDPGAASWMLAAYGTAIHAMGDNTFATGCADLIVADLDPETGEQYLVGDHMALAECLEFLSQLDPETYSDPISRIITELVDAQDTDGCWYEGSAGTFQDTVYAVRTLAVYGGNDGQNAARKGAAWLIANQLVNGGWLDGGTEYSEQDAEGLRALVATAAPVTIGEMGYYSIQQAIDAALPDDTIEVAAGEYAGAIVNENVTISGAADGESIIASGVHYGGGAPGLETAFRLDADADGAEIRNFTINCDNSANFYFAVFSRGADNVIVNSLTVDDAVQGITNYGGSNWEITNNVLTDTEAVGGGGIAIFLGARPDYPVCSGNLIENNTITATATAETYTCPGISMAVDLRYGRYDLLTGNENMSNNQILNNTITAPGALNGVGIEIGVIGLEDNATKIATCLGMISNNDVQGNTVDGADMGIFIYTVTNLTIHQNEIKNCDNGIYIKDDHSGVAINYNNIVGNTIGINNTSTSTVDATLNWWGDPSGPSGVGLGSGDAVSANVDYRPWLDAPYQIGAARSFNVLNESTEAEFDTIQAAINAAEPSDTVLVHPGTYSEVITIGKALTVRSTAGAEETTIDGTGLYIVIIRHSDVTFEGFTVTNPDYASGGDASGILVETVTEPISNVRILNNIITRVRSESGTPSMFGATGINIGYAATKGFTLSDVVISGNTIENIHNPDGASVDHTCGINVWDGAENILISNNAISDIKYNGIILQCASNVRIENNAITECEVGIRVEPFEGATVSNLMIHHNNIENSCNGIAGETSNSVISNNIIHDSLNIPGSAGVGILLWGNNDNNVIENNEIYNNDRQGIFIGFKDNTKISTKNTITRNLVYNNGLYTYSNGPDASAYGIQLWNADNNLIEGNEIYGHDNWFPYVDSDFDFAQGIYLCDSTNNTVTKNNLHGNNYGVGIWHPARVAGINSINYNNITGNTGYGVRNYDDFTVDATHNYWGHPSGPRRDKGNPNCKAGRGDRVSENVRYQPWLSKPFQTVLEKHVGHYGFEGRYLEKGWNTLSVPIYLDNNAWEEIAACLDENIAYRFNASTQAWELMTTDSKLDPLDAIYIRMNAENIVPLVVSVSIRSPPVKELKRGWNLIGLAVWEEENMSVDRALVSVELTPDDKRGYTIVVSSPLNQEPWTVYTIGQPGEKPLMNKNKAYWVYMENPDNLAGFSTTPLPFWEPE